MQQSIVGDPLFQMNLMLLMTWPATPHSGVSPLFLESGYEIRFVERMVPVPPTLRQRLLAVGISLQESTSHDLLLEHQASRTFLPIECKRSSFGSASGTARQARSMLVLDQKILATFVGKPPSEVWDAVLTYAVAQGSGDLMMETLADLHGEISRHGIALSKYSCIEFCEDETAVCIRSPLGATPLPGLDFTQCEVALSIPKGGTPHILYLIPYMTGGPDGDDAVAEEVFRERLRVGTMQLFAEAGEQSHEFDLEGYVLKKAIVVWDLWYETGMKGVLRSYARTFIRDVFADLRRATGVACTISNRTITLPSMSLLEVAKVRQFLVGAAYRHRQMPSTTAPSQESLDI